MILSLLFSIIVVVVLAFCVKNSTAHNIVFVFILLVAFAVAKSHIDDTPIIQSGSNFLFQLGKFAVTFFVELANISFGIGVTFFFCVPKQMNRAWICRIVIFSINSCFYILHLHFDMEEMHSFVIGSIFGVNGIIFAGLFLQYLQTQSKVDLDSVFFTIITFLCCILHVIANFGLKYYLSKYASSDFQLHVTTIAGIAALAINALYALQPMLKLPPPNQQQVNQNQQPLLHNQQQVNQAPAIPYVRRGWFLN